MSGEVTEPVAARARELKQQWLAVLAWDERERSDESRAAEQRHWDVLVDFVEENGLNYTEFDPRGMGTNDD